MSKPAKKVKAAKPLTNKSGEVRELTTADIKRMRPAADVVEHFKSTGPGWQTRINQALRKAVGM